VIFEHSTVARLIDKKSPRTKIATAGCKTSGPGFCQRSQKTWQQRFQAASASPPDKRLTSPVGPPNRGAVNALEAVKLATEAKPRLEIVGRSSMEVRAAALMRIRTTLWAEFERLNVIGPQYLVVETALRFLIGHLDGTRPGETLSLDASDMQATPEDHQLLVDNGPVMKKIVRKRTARTSFLKPDQNKGQKSL
jgi:hypothetical protein